MSPPADEDSLVTPPATVAAPAPASGTGPAPASRAGPDVARGGALASASGGALRVLAALAVVAALCLGRAILVPVALAALVAFLLAPVARWLERVRVPRAVAASICVLALAGALLGVLAETGAQAVDLARRLPEYRQRIEAKFATLVGGGVASPIIEASARWKELQGTLTPDAPDASEPTAGAAQPPRRPAAVPVRVVPDEPTTLDVFGNVAGSLLGPLGDAAVVVLLAIFLLSSRTEVRERLLALGSARRIGVTSQALEEAGRRVARYLLSNLAVNVLYGTAVGVALHLVGVPNAGLLGVLCALLRFIPYVGTWIGALLPLAMSVAVFDGWGRTGAVFASILGIDVVVGNVVEPIVYGHRTGLSPLAVVLATVFWTWAWGVPGLLLAIPVTLCFAVVGRFVPGFGVFHVLLGDEAVLDPAERVYERLLAFDATGAARVVREARAKLAPASADDAVLLPALRHAERDRREGQLDDARYVAICDGVRAALDELETSSVPAPSAGSTLCLPALTESDHVACELLARHLAAAGFATEIGPNATTSSDAVAKARGEGVAAVYVVALPPFASLRVRFGIRRARSQAPDLRCVAVVLDPGADRTRVEAALAQAGAAATYFSLAEVVAGLPSDPAATPGEATRAAATATARTDAASNG